jgi:hypothetical protein
VEIVKADDSACIALAESQGDLHEGAVKCLTGRDLSNYDYASVGKDGFIPVNVKSMIVTRLKNASVTNDE